MAMERTRPCRRTSNISRMLLCLAAGMGLAVAQRCYAAEPPLEYQVKAAFLLNFTRFIEWPASAFATAGSPFAICILGRDPFGQALDQIVRGESESGHPMTVVRIAEPPRPQACQMIFVSADAADVPKILRGLGPGILTVGDSDSFIREGGMIAFAIENRHVRFAINQAAAQGAGLKLSSRLLTVARSVKK